MPKYLIEVETKNTWDPQDIADHLMGCVSVSYSESLIDYDFGNEYENNTLNIQPLIWE